MHISTIRLQKRHRPDNGRTPSSTTALVAVVAAGLLSACDSSTGVAITAAVKDPVVFPENLGTVNGAPDAQFDGSIVTLRNKNLPSHQTVVVADAGAESAQQNNGASADLSANGFEATGECGYSNTDVAASNGHWRFELGSQCILNQITDTTLKAGEGISLVYDTLLDTSVIEPQLHVEIFVLNADGDAVGLSSKILNPRTQTGWNSFQSSVAFGAGDELVGGKIGIRFSSLRDDTSIGIDAIELKTHTVSAVADNSFSENWQGQCDQTWIGENYWSNRLQDWQVVGERLNTIETDTLRPNRTTHRISTVMSAAPADFSLKVDTGTMDGTANDTYSGIWLGAGGRMDYRSSSLVHNRFGKNGGILVGIDNRGRVFITEHGVSKFRLTTGSSSNAAGTDGATLQVDGRYLENGRYNLHVFAINQDNKVISSTQGEVSAEALLGNIALVSNPSESGITHWFDNWTGFGGKLIDEPSRQFGPTLFSSYTVSENVLTVNAQYGPVCANEMPAPTLEVFKGNAWQAIGEAQIDPESYTARFSVDNWAEESAMHYRIATNMQSQGSDKTSYFEGSIQADPAQNDDFTIGVFNCRPGLIASNEEGWIDQNGQFPFSWTRERIAFPHEELLENAQQHPLDMVAFLGDQLYEFDPNSVVVEDPEFIGLDYLWKWYQFGWSAREVMRNTPSFMMPDDHDIYQGNVWGQEGIVAATPPDGGYVFPPSFINLVQRTQTGSLPAPHSSAPLNQDIKTYYTDIVYGDVGFAVIEDRKFKTGPNSAVRPLQLLGDAQHAFLDEWAANWDGHSMKLAFSQSPFSQSTSHSGQMFGKVNRDWDSNGWPKAGRDNAVQLLRKAYAPHISGDQHLGMSLQHGIENHGDAIYSFAGPSMLNIFPRIWDPTNEGAGPGSRDSIYQGEFTDAHGNLIDVLAAANPNIYYREIDENAIPSKNDLGIGYGIVRLNKPTKQYTFEAWPANVSPNDDGALPYDGWPITFDQTANDGREPVGFLPPRQAAVDQPVVQVFDESDGALVYARRYPSASVELPIYDAQASYRVVLSDPSISYLEEFSNQTVE